MSQWRVLVFVVCLGLGWAAPARADAVTYWNDVAVQAVTAGRPGGHGFVDMALVQAAIHDAVQAIQRRFQPFAATVQGTGSADAAAAAAAYGVLAGIYPKQQEMLDARYKAYLADNKLAGNPGLAVGQQVAAVLVKQHRAVVTLPDYKGGTKPGEWRPTPSFLGTPAAPAAFSPMANVYLANARPYTLERPTQFRAPAPPALTSAEYLRDYNEVKAAGALKSTTRTAAQTDLAYFWSENYVSQWNRAMRAIAESRTLSIGERARMFALANLAAADAVITVWDSKRYHSFWRPVTAIREAEGDGNPGTVPDADWQPLVNTPNYPDHTSGANGVTAAVTRSLENFFGTDTVEFTVTSEAPLAKQKARTFKRFSDAAQEVVDARIFLGIHFRFADDAARTQGRQVADWVFARTLRPVPASR
jgi:hypothetical protein